MEALGVGSPIFGDVPNHTEKTRSYPMVQPGTRSGETPSRGVCRCQPSIVLTDCHGELVFYTASASRAVVEVLVL